MPLADQIAITAFLALIPAMIWGAIFYTKDPVDRPKTAQTFLLGISSVLPILLYKWSWDTLPEINVFNYANQLKADIFHFTPYLYLPVGSVVGFAFVGVIEEYMKHWVVVKGDHGFFRNIDDAIEFSIIAALGFAFFENALYFYYIWTYQGHEVLLASFAFRGIFSTFAHILFSGIYGYYYGIAYFAEPIWSEEQRQKRSPWKQWIHKHLQFKNHRAFAFEKQTEGLVMAVSLHALFNIMLEMNLTFFLVPFLAIGYSHLDHLFKEKENLKMYGYLVGEDSSAHLHQRFWRTLPRFKRA